MKTTRLAEVAYSSEWFLAKLFNVLEQDDTKELFELISISGREATIPKALERMDYLINKRTGNQNSQDYSKRNESTELRSLQTLEKRLREGNLNYFPIDSVTGTLNEAVFDQCDALYISTKNTTHADLILQAVKKGKPVLCEKPLCVVLDNKGAANKTQLEQLANLAYGNAIILDAEHYSYKASSQNFYKNIATILRGRQIVEIKGEIIEHDSPWKERNINLLNQNSQTGLLIDTGVHLLSFISNLGYVAIPKKAKYGMFNGQDKNSGQPLSYNTETSAEVTYELKADQSENKLIREGTIFELTVEKFGQYRERVNKSKTLTLTLSDRSTITIDFDNKSGTINERHNELITAHSAQGINPSEYVNILHEFNRAIKTPGYRALTDFRNSLRTLSAVHATYALAPIIKPNNITIQYATN